MLKYTTQDIIDRAKELADLQNSDFITWAENMHLLDESYKKLYQEVINANDKYYVQTVNLSDLVIAGRAEKEVRYYLPEDFYQLQSITVDSGANVVLKKATTESKSAFRYDFINDTLVLYGGVESRNPVISYYPVPKTLTVKAPEVQAVVEGYILDCNGSKYLTSELTDTGTTIKVFDISSNVERAYTVAIQSAIVNGYLGHKAALLITSTEMYHLNLSTGALEDVTGGFPAKADGEVYVIDENTPSHNIYRGTNLTTAWKEDVIWTDPTRTGFELYTFNPEDLSVVYMISNNSIIECSEESYKAVDSVTNQDKMEWIKGSLFYVKDDVMKDGVSIIDYREFDEVYGFNKVDYNTGYGISLSSLDDSYVHIKSCFIDTVLDFPNNFHFTYLAYQLAIAYKAKQNADASALITRSGEEAAQFYDSMSRDTAESFRIQNVYGGNY